MNRKKCLFAVFIMSFAFAGFSQNLNFKVAGATRNCILHVPTSGINNPPPALVFILHGLGGDGAGMQSTTQMDKIADREKFIVAYPSAISGTWDHTTTKNDYTFLLSIIDTVDAKYNIDRSKVYVTGFSQGGGMTVFIGFQYPDVFAAIAPVSSVGKGATIPKSPIPIFLTFGTKDLYIPDTFMTYVKSWVGINKCSITPKVTRPYPVSNAKSTVTRLVYEPNTKGAEIVVDSISGGIHEWPMDATTKVNNSEEVWAFFKRFSLPATTSIGRQPVSAIREPVSASYSSGIIRVSGVKENCRVLVMDTKGRLVAKENIVNRQFAFKDKQSGAYMVIVSGKEGSVVLRLVVP